MLFAHGFGCDQNMWRLVAPGVRRRFRVILFDYVGAGGSDQTAYDSKRYDSLDGYADDVVEIVRELDLRDVVFVGHSVSSMIGVLAQAAEPERFASLVMVGPSPRYIDDEAYGGGFGEADIVEMLDSLESNYLGWSRGDGAGDHEQPGPAGARRGADRRASAGWTPRSLASSPGSRSCPTPAPTWPGSTVPTLVLQCTNDLIAPVAVGTYVRDAIPGSDLVMLEATGHCPQPERPGRDDPGDLGLRRPDRAPVGDEGLEMTQREGARGVPRRAVVRRPGAALRARALRLPLDHAGRSDRQGQRDVPHLDRAGRTTSWSAGARSPTCSAPGGRIYHETHFAPALRMHDSVREIALDLVRGDGAGCRCWSTPRSSATRTGGPGSIRIAVFDATERRGVRARAAARQGGRGGLRGAGPRAGPDPAADADPADAPGDPGRWTWRRSYRPAGEGVEVGGDFYDVFPVGRDDWVVVIGDVCGKGVDAAVVTALVRHTVRALAVAHEEPRDMLRGPQRGAARSTRPSASARWR